MNSANIQEPKIKRKLNPPLWRAALRNSLSKVRHRELPRLENPLTPEEQTPKMMAIYRRLEKQTGNDFCSDLTSKVIKLAEDEGKKCSEPYSRKVIPPSDTLQYSLKNIAEDLEVDPKKALACLAPKAGSFLPEGTPLKQDTLFTNQDILKVQEALVQELLMDCPPAAKAGKGGWTSPHIVTGAERDTPTQLMEYDALTAFFRKWKEDLEKLRERQKVQQRRYQEEIARVTAQKPAVEVFSPWAEKYEKMKALISRRQAEIEDCYQRKRKMWDARLVDGWVKKHTKEAPVENPFDSEPYIFTFSQTIILFLCMCVFALSWKSFGMSNSIQHHFISTLHFWTCAPECIQSLFSRDGAVTLLVLMALGAWLCRRLFCWVYTYNNAYATIFWLIVCFMLVDFLLQPFLFSALFSYPNTFMLCCILQAPLATLLHMGVWFIRKIWG